MINIDFRFYVFSHLVIFLFIALACILWVQLLLKKGSKLNLLPFVLLQAALFVAWWRLAGINVDETEHLHCAWMVSQGQIPYRDFWQVHPPFLWLSLSPIFKVLKPTAEIFEISRILAAAIFCIAAFLGWQISKMLWDKRANASLYALILLSAALEGEYLRLRPDTFLYIFLLAGIYFSLKIPGANKSPAFFAGISFALAFSFIGKQYLVYLLPVVAIVTEGKKKKLFKLLAYGLGFIIGTIPLLWYLMQNNVLGYYAHWVFVFNAKRIVWLVSFPLGVGVAGVWGAYLLYRRYASFREPVLLIGLFAFILSTFSSFSTCVITVTNYYLGFWFILCAVMASGLDIKLGLRKLGNSTKISIVSGAFLAILLMPNIIKVKVHDKYFFQRDKKEISELLRVSVGDSCVTFIPYHPVFVSDATRLYSNWQYNYSYNIKDVKEDAKSKNIANEIIIRKPALMVYRKYGVWFPLELYIRDLISEEDLKRLKAFLENNYRVKYIGENLYYIRNDFKG